MFRVRFLFGMCMYFAIPLNVVAETPEEAVNALISKMKSASSLSPLVEQIDWETRFNAMKPEERNAFGFQGPDDMKKHYLQKVESNGEDQLERVKSAAKEDGPQSKYGKSNPVTRVEDELGRQQSALASRLVETTYKIVKVERPAAGEAIATVKKTFQKQSEDVTVKLRQSGGRWLVENGAPLNPSPANLSGASPVGQLPEPAAVLGQP